MNGKGLIFYKRVIKVFFEDKKNTGDIDVLAELAGEVGLNSDQFKAAMKERQFETIHKKGLLDVCRDPNVQGVPTMYIGNKIVQGYHKFEALEKLINEQIKNLAAPQVISEGVSCKLEGC